MSWSGRRRVVKRRGLGSSLGRAAERPTPRTRLPVVPRGYAAPLVDEAALATVIARAFADLDERLDFQSVLAMLLEGDYGALIDLVDWDEWERQMTEAMLPRYRLATEREGAKAMAEVIGGRLATQASAAAVRSGSAGAGYPPNIPPSTPGIPAAPSPRSGGFYGSVRFDTTNPFALARAESSAAELVREVSRSTRMAIKELVAESFRDGVTVDELGRRLRNTIGLTSRQARAVENYRQRLVNGGLLDDDRIDVLTRRYFRRTRNRRAQTIARTEIMKASNHGRMEGWLSAADQGLLDPMRSTKEWVTAPERSSYGPPCPTCLPMDGVRVTGIESEFELPGGRRVQMPPAHPNCRCTAVVWPPEIPDDFVVEDVIYTGPVAKHGGGSHDDASHGNWAHGGAPWAGSTRPELYDSKRPEETYWDPSDDPVDDALKRWVGQHSETIRDGSNELGRRNRDVLLDAVENGDYRGTAWSGRTTPAGEVTFTPGETIDLPLTSFTKSPYLARARASHYESGLDHWVLEFEADGTGALDVQSRDLHYGHEQEVLTAGTFEVESVREVVDDEVYGTPITYKIVRLNRR